MKRTAEFWMRISITLFFILLALSAPIIFSRSEYLLSYLFCLHRLLKNYING